MRAVTKYLAVQIPGWLAWAVVLGAFWEWRIIPAWVVGVLLGLYVVKDVVMFPFVRRAYETNTQHGPAQLVGAVGTACDRLNPTGYVRVRGELWRAESTDAEPIEVGASVRIIGASGYTLRVTGA